MDIKVQRDSETTQTVEITIEESVVNKEVINILKRQAGSMKQNGFRRGKVPMQLLKKRYGKSARLDAINAAIDRGVTQALGDKQLKSVIHISQPELIDGVAAGAVKVSFKAENFPEVKPKGYLGVEVLREKAKVGADEVKEELKQLQESLTQHAPVEDRDKVRKDDVVVVTYRGVGEGDITQIEQDEQSIWLGSEHLLEGFADGLKGMKVGTTKTIDVVMPEQFQIESLAGKPAQLEVTLKGLQTRDVPKLDDDLAKESGEAETLAELKKNIKARLKEQREKSHESAARQRMMKTVVAANDFEIPPLYLQAQCEREARQRLQSLMGYGVNIADLGIDLAQFAQSMRGDVEQSVRESLLLRAIADEEKEVKVLKKDIDAWMKERAEAQGVALAKFKAQFSDDEAMERLKSGLLLEQALDFVWSKATIKLVDEVPAEAPPESADAPAESEETSGDGEA